MTESCERREIYISNWLINDGLHPNDKGYSVMYYLINNALGFATEKSFHEVDTGWIDIPLNDGFIARENHTPQYRKIGNKVYLRGQIVKTLEGNGINITTLPVGFSPTIPCQKTGLSGYLFTPYINYIIQNGDLRSIGGYNSSNVVDNYIPLDDFSPFLID